MNKLLYSSAIVPMDVDIGITGWDGLVISQPNNNCANLGAADIHFSQESDTMAKNKLGKKCRAIMYEQQVRYLPNEQSPQELYNLLLENLKPELCALIVHDKDTKEDGVTPVEPHIHIMMRFENARSLNSVANILGDKPQYFEAWPRNYKNGFSYLIHATDRAKNKYQYSASEVIANFDYIAFIKDVEEKVVSASRKTTKEKVDYILNMVASGDMTIREAREEMTGAEYAKNCHLLQRANEKNLIRKAEELKEELMISNKPVEVYWIYGTTGTGKTRMAKAIARGEKEEFYISSTRKDPFQFYSGEHIIILDEIRSETIYYSELLSILDPFSLGAVKVTSRYSNKILSCRMFIITTPYSPTTFHRYYNLPASDTGEQLYRRLTTVVEMDEKYITKMVFDNNKMAYVPDSYIENSFYKVDISRAEGRDLFSLI